MVEHLIPMQAFVVGSRPCSERFFSMQAFVVGSRPCSERFFSAYSGFPLSPKTNTSKFQFDLESVPDSWA